MDHGSNNFLSRSDFDPEAAACRERLFSTPGLRDPSRMLGGSKFGIGSDARTTLDPRDLSAMINTVPYNATQNMQEREQLEIEKLKAEIAVLDAQKAYWEMMTMKAQVNVFPDVILGKISQDT